MAGVGKGMPQNVAEALKWFRLAAQQGYAPAWQLLKRIEEH